MNQSEKDKIRNVVRSNYGKVAESNTETGCGCSASSCCDDSKKNSLEDASVALGYSPQDLGAAPEGANMGLGCGNPHAIASLKKGETVLDLGSGGGFDCFLALKKVGDAGQVIGVDMTPKMITKARNNADKINQSNIEFRLGEIENIPVADEVIDVIMSNCVINLSPDKKRVFQEAFRVLKPGGRLAISDVVAYDALPSNVKEDMALYAGCVAGAESINELESILGQVGFSNIRIQPKAESREVVKSWFPGRNVADYVVSATIEAIKPKA